MKPVALILGASSGMGYASAELLAQNGYDLILVYRARKAEAQRVEKEHENWRKNWGIRVWAYNQDALRDEPRQAILKQAQENGLQVKLVLHSLAKGNLKAMVAKNETDRLLNAQDFELTLNAMATSYYTWVSSLYQKSLLAPRASFLALTSEGARKAWSHYGAVSAAKAALEAINRQLALELGALGHRANILQPGVTDTPALRLIPGSDKLIKLAQKRNPRGELTTPEKVARVVLLMASRESEWINGAVIPVDGGESIA